MGDRQRKFFTRLSTAVGARGGDGDVASGRVHENDNRGSAVTTDPQSSSSGDGSYEFISRDRTALFKSQRERHTTRAKSELDRIGHTFQLLQFAVQRQRDSLRAKHHLSHSPSSSNSNESWGAFFKRKLKMGRDATNNWAEDVVKSTGSDASHCYRCRLSFNVLRQSRVCPLCTKQVCSECLPPENIVIVDPDRHSPLPLTTVYGKQVIDRARVAHLPQVIVCGRCFGLLRMEREKLFVQEMVYTDSNEILKFYRIVSESLTLVEQKLPVLKVIVEALKEAKGRQPIELEAAIELQRELKSAFESLDSASKQLLALPRTSPAEKKLLTNVQHWHIKHVQETVPEYRVMTKELAMNIQARQSRGGSTTRGGDESRSSGGSSGGGGGGDTSGGGSRGASDSAEERARFRAEQVPKFVSIDPVVSPLRGTIALVTCDDLQLGALVRIGNVPCNCARASRKVIYCETPALKPGFHAVEIRNPNQKSVVMESLMLYTDQVPAVSSEVRKFGSTGEKGGSLEWSLGTGTPTISSLEPAFSPLSGGVKARLSGENIRPMAIIRVAGIEVEYYYDEPPSAGRRWPELLEGGSGRATTHYHREASAKQETLHFVTPPYPRDGFVRVEVENRDGTMVGEQNASAYWLEWLS